jgi:hypothetical protein
MFSPSPQIGHRNRGYSPGCSPDVRALNDARKPDAVSVPLRARAFDDHWRNAAAVAAARVPAVPREGDDRKRASATSAAMMSRNWTMVITSVVLIGTAIVPNPMGTHQAFFGKLHGCACVSALNPHVLCGLPRCTPEGIHHAGEDHAGESAPPGGVSRGSTGGPRAGAQRRQHWRYRLPDER